VPGKNRRNGRGKKGQNGYPIPAAGEFSREAIFSGHRFPVNEGHLFGYSIPSYAGFLLIPVVAAGPEV